MTSLSSKIYNHVLERQVILKDQSITITKAISLFYADVYISIHDMYISFPYLCTLYCLPQINCYIWCFCKSSKCIEQRCFEPWRDRACEEAETYHLREPLLILS